MTTDGIISCCEQIFAVLQRVLQPKQPALVFLTILRYRASQKQTTKKRQQEKSNPELISFGDGEVTKLGRYTSKTCFSLDFTVNSQIQ